MQTLQLNETDDTTLDASGNGTVKLGPTGQSEVWTVNVAAVIASSSTLNALCKLYAGPTATAQYLVDVTPDGSTGDASDNCQYVPLPKGWFVHAVWTGGDVGATATLNAIGTRQVPLCLSALIV